MPLVGLAFIAAACGGSSPKTASGGASTTTVAGAAGRTNFVTCLEQHGVPASVASSGFGGGFGRGGGDAPGAGGDPAAGSGSGGDTSSTTLNPLRTQYASAFSACRSDLPSRIGEGGFQDSAAAKAYENCLSAHGVTIPSTPPPSTAGGGPPSSGGFGALSQEPAYKAAAAACAALRPKFGGSTTTTTA